MKNQSETNLKLRKESIVKFSFDSFWDDMNLYSVPLCPTKI
jgi:hypothetical protein